MLDPQIASSPQNADLLLKRANLFRRHQEWDRALSDLDRAAARGADRGTISLARAQVELEREGPGAAIEALDLANSRTAFGRRRSQPGTRKCRLGRHAEADRDFAGALERLVDARPDYYLEWAGAVAASGEAALPSAISLLDAGLVHSPAPLHCRNAPLITNAGCAALRRPSSGSRRSCERRRRPFTGVWCALTCSPNPVGPARPQPLTVRPPKNYGSFPASAIRARHATPRR